MDNQTTLIATAGFALAGVAGYMYLNASKDPESENAKLAGSSNENESKNPLTNAWSNFWGQEHKKLKVVEELKEKADPSLYN
jgi:ABC-type phosphate transport system substrate-binding protein